MLLEPTIASVAGTPTWIQNSKRNREIRKQTSLDSMRVTAMRNDQVVLDVIQNWISSFAHMNLRAISFSWRHCHFF